MMALVADQFDTMATNASTPSPNPSANLTDAAKQATKALKCVASTTKQVGELLTRKHERVLKRIGAITEEIESLKAEVMENIAHQRDRRLQLSEIEEDLEQAQLLGNSAIIESLYDELFVTKEETKREESLYRMLCKTVRNRKEVKKQFLQERLAVEEEMRTFAQKQKLIQTLLATCSKQSSSSDFECLEDAENDDNDDDNLSHDGSSSSGSFPENPLDTPPFRAMSPPPRMMSPMSIMSPPRTMSPLRMSPTSVERKEKVVKKSVSLIDPRSETPSEPSAANGFRLRSWSSDSIQPLPATQTVNPRGRRSLSVHFASPVLTASTVKTNDAALDKELESLDLSHYLSSVSDMSPVISAAPSSVTEDDQLPAPAVRAQEQTEAATVEVAPVAKADETAEVSAAPGVAA